MALSVVILAAGKSTRFKSERPKVLHDLEERPMIDYTLDLAARLALEPPVVVIGPEIEDEIRTWAGDRVRYVLQRERLGTGHAVQQAEPLLRDTSEQVLVLYGDMPLLKAETLLQLARLQAATDAAVAMLTVERDNPRGFGRILRRGGSGDILGIVEEAEATPEQRAIRELNVGIYVFEADFLWDALPKIEPSARKGEYYLTDLVKMAADARREVVSVSIDDPVEALGINTRADFAVAQAVLRQRVNEHWMLEGVTLVDAATTYIGPNVVIGPDTTIYPNTHLRGQTVIGAGCDIGPNAIIENCALGDRCRVLASVLEDAVMEDDSDIGPFGHLRKGSRLCRGAHMGNFGEMKQSTLGPGSKMGHVSYLGDTETGANVNIGAGTITCNYDGARKHPTVIEDGAFIGSDTMLVAPVRVGKGATTGAGAVVTRDVPPGTVVYGVPARSKSEPPSEE